MKKLNLKNVSSDTWIRTLVLFMALISQFLVITGKKTETIDIDKYTEYATYGATVISSIWAWWKNNSFTAKAQKADTYLHDESEVE